MVAHITQENLVHYQKQLQNQSADFIIDWVLDSFEPSMIALASSLSIEDQVLTHMLWKRNPTFQIFTLDTGRLPQETFDVMEKTAQAYQGNYDILFPDSAAVKDMINRDGPNLFYDSIENRKMCCGIRKIQPLKQKLSGLTAWVCGLRKEQSVTRTESQALEWDSVFGLIKINPLVEWQESEVWDYIHNHEIPYSVLYDQGYRSIGCAPCTRAIDKDDDVRAGRWWWEAPEHKECGLHCKK